MNYQILNKYGLTMRSTGERFWGHIEGDVIADYIFIYRNPDDVQKFIDDIDLAINNQYRQIVNPDYCASRSARPNNFWFANITPTHFELWHESENYNDRRIIPLQDWKEILLSWKECVEG